MRRVAVVVLVLVGAVLAPLGIGGTWARANVADEDQWARVIQEAIDAPTVQQAVATEVADLIVDAVDLEQLARQLLPDQVDGLTGLGGLLPGIQQRAEEYIRDAVTSTLDSDALDPVWQALATQAQRQLIAVLEGEDAGALRATEDGIVLDTDALVAAVWDRIARGPLAFLDDHEPPTGAPDVLLVEAEGLVVAQRVWWAASWAPWLIAGAVVAWLLALVLARRRLLVLALEAGLLVVGCGVLGWLVHQGRLRIVAEVPRPSSETVALGLWDSAARPFLDMLAWVSLVAGAVGVLALVAAAVVSRTSPRKELA